VHCRVLATKSLGEMAAVTPKASSNELPKRPDGVEWRCGPPDRLQPPHGGLPTTERS